MELSLRCDSAATPTAALSLQFTLPEGYAVYDVDSGSGIVSNELSYSYTDSTLNVLYLDNDAGGSPVEPGSEVAKIKLTAATPGTGRPLVCIESDASLVTVEGKVETQGIDLTISDMTVTGEAVPVPTTVPSVSTDGKKQTMAEASSNAASESATMTERLQEQQAKQNGDATANELSPTATPETSPTPTPEPTVAPAMATATSNATKDAPQIKDPTTWDDNAAKTLAGLKTQFAAYGLTLDAKEGYPYLLAVNNAGGVVTVYAVDSATKKYAVPFMAMVCSGGMDTPTGYFSTPVDYSWRLLMGPSYGQYATRIYDSYLFHSVPYYSQHKDDVEYDEFNLLGTRASLGCIRLAVVDVKWIYDNCPLGTPVIIYNDADDPGPMGKPGTIYTDPADTEKRGWDPTDPDSANPWDAAFRSGTAIRSEAAWNEWNDAQNDGRWNGSINPADLQGWSTDSSVEGTRG